MRKPADISPTSDKKDPGKDMSPQANDAAASAPKAWPFAPGSQLGKQVARPWTPKPVYRFNQR